MLDEKTGEKCQMDNKHPAWWLSTDDSITQQYWGKTLFQNAPCPPLYVVFYVLCISCFMFMSFLFIVLYVLCNKQKHKTNTNDSKKGKGINTRLGKS